MASPPGSPSHNLQGTSRTMGGIIRGQALGNVFNHADAPKKQQDRRELRMGRIHIYTSHIDPTQNKAHMGFKHEVTPRLKPILKALARSYSPVHSKPVITYKFNF